MVPSINFTTALAPYLRGTVSVTFNSIDNNGKGYALLANNFAHLNRVTFSPLELELLVDLYIAHLQDIHSFTYHTSCHDAT